MDGNSTLKSCGMISTNFATRDDGSGGQGPNMMFSTGASNNATNTLGVKGH